MRRLPDISITFKNEYFWDVDIRNLDPDRSGRLIIERIFQMGNIEDIRTVIRYYGEKKILNVLCNLNYLDPKTLNFVSRLFKKPLKDFKCYTRRRLNRQYWNF